MTARDDALDPDTEPRDLLVLSESCPAEVLANPVLAVLSVSDPALWQDIVTKCLVIIANEHVQAWRKRSSKEEWKAFVALCRARFMNTYTLAQRFGESVSGPEVVLNTSCLHLLLRLGRGSEPALAGEFALWQVVALYRNQGVAVPAAFRPFIRNGRGRR